jgi:hypothetical protein
MRPGDARVDPHGDARRVGRGELIDDRGHGVEAVHGADRALALGGEGADDSEGRPRVVRHALDRTVDARDERLAIDDDQLAVEQVERAESEIPLLEQLADRQVAPQLTAQERIERRGLERLVVIWHVIGCLRAPQARHADAADESVVDGHGAILARAAKADRPAGG